MTTTAGKIIVLTGVTKGLGRSLVDRFVESGQTVIGCGRSQGPINELRSLYGAPHHFSTVDVSRDDSVRAWAETVLDKYGPPDILINNAAIMNESAPLWEVSAEEFDRLTAININGVANVIRQFVPAMVERTAGVIVNLSSGWGRATGPDVAPYCATKWAIEGLTQALAQELPEGMAAVPLNPGIINTDMLQICFGDSANRFGTAEEWSHAAAELILGIGPQDNGRQLTAAS
ncbi:3-oxoacyl-[acyl-carrier-protein] reductase FabG [Symmachiella macrocystis]|uniref:3-oxoacyl-[acyl-carrier-protein] reductase FabG n=1 Tax=Symmachiella macrocystis TaxID=2527985 RepID=A0A5C6BT76_9PLAN|nr:SDR family NAD(P)-dependent oxidoreductase [Symmachiella macrocystis]TWU14661.1 3-oxoacyl-[acyl-carrier-protein] reductase FabG [Symmachiella macrocystis]